MSKETYQKPKNTPYVVGITEDKNALSFDPITGTFSWEGLQSNVYNVRPKEEILTNQVLTTGKRNERILEDPRVKKMLKILAADPGIKFVS
jgi:hypothetical protein